MAVFIFPFVCNLKCVMLPVLARLLMLMDALYGASCKKANRTRTGKWMMRAPAAAESNDDQQKGRQVFFLFCFCVRSFTIKLHDQNVFKFTQALCRKVRCTGNLSDNKQDIRDINTSPCAFCFLPGTGLQPIDCAQNVL